MLLWFNPWLVVFKDIVLIYFTAFWHLLFYHQLSPEVPQLVLFLLISFLLLSCVLLSWFFSYAMLRTFMRRTLFSVCHSGGDMMSLLIKKGIFEEPLARFYVAELTLALESVHLMGFVHRLVIFCWTSCLLFSFFIFPQHGLYLRLLLKTYWRA